MFVSSEQPQIVPDRVERTFSQMAPEVGIVESQDLQERVL